MIPDWNALGVLPPIRPGRLGHHSDRSPYAAPLHKIIERFGTTPERISILNGLLQYRQEFHELGIVSGFQWLDGSFVEQVEVLDSRPPHDVDVVTFLSLPHGLEQDKIVVSHSHLFEPTQTKARFKVDGYSCPLGEPMEASHVKIIAYWYSMWSHKRSGTWKGFVQVDLSPQEDVLAKIALDMLAGQGGLA